MWGVVICRMDIKFHYICETVLPGKITVLPGKITVLPGKITVLHTDMFATLLFIVLSLSERCCLCSLRVFLQPSLSLFITPSLEALSLSALLVLSFTLGLLTLFTALSFSSLESSG